MKDLGATKVIVSGGFKSADDYTKAIIDATDGKRLLFYRLLCDLIALLLYIFIQ